MAEELQFTGEYMVPAKSGERIEADHLERYRFAAKHVAGQRILDIACGAGYASEIMIDAGATSYTGVDIKPELVDYARTKYGSDNIAFEQGDVCFWKSDTRYGVVCCFETIEHVADFRSAIANIFSVLAPGGMLFISSPNRPVTTPAAKKLEDPPGNKYHTQEFIVPELRSELVSAGFEVRQDGIFGQRMRVQWFVRYANAILRRLSLPLLDPDTTALPDLTPVRWMSPRYFLIAAHKPDA
ncbi:MAG: methyltransferase domain-containing protein [Pseudomonadota bacterium]